MRRLALCRPKEARSMTRQLVAALLVLSLLAAGCGKKGPLYHPEEKKQEEKSQQEPQALPPPSSTPGY